VSNLNVTYEEMHSAASQLKAGRAEIEGQLSKLKSMVDGVDRMALSPYAGLKTPISLQAWNYQLFVQSASDPRVAQFIDALRYNKKVTPEYGALCSGSGFKASQSYPGHPYEG